MGDFRIKRVQSMLRDEISRMIIQNVIKDPRIDSLMSITDVKVSKDTSYAKVSISGFGKREEIDNAVKALNHAAGFIQGKLGKRLQLRHTPRLSFIADHSVEEAIEINRKIEELNS